MPLTQEQVNQLAKEAAAQAGGTISYQDALKAAANYGITPEQVNAALSTGVITGAPAAFYTSSISNSYLNANPDVKAEYQRFSQQDPTKWTPESYSAYHYLNYGANENRQGAEGINSYLNNLTKQIMSTSDTSKWSGEGKGSAEANAKDMAGIMLGLGITDLKDFGQITIQVPEYDEFGNIIQTHAQTTFGNKRTGQAVPNTYGERQTGDAFGGTYSGSGNTGYRVQFDAQGNPHFYTSEQSSSSIGELMPLIQIGLLATGAGGLLGGALNSGLGLGLGSAGSAALGGATIGGLTSAATGGNVLQGALLGGAGGYLSNALSAGITDQATLQAAMDADIAGGMVPEFGTNAAYDSFMANAMTPAARLALETQIASGNGAWLGENVPSGVPEWDTAFTNAGGTFDTAYTTPTTTATRTDLPQASYSNEGRNYPTPESTQGTGGSPVNASVATTNGLPLVDTTGSGLNISPNTALNAARLAAGLLGGGAVAGALTNTGGGSNVVPTQGVPVANQDYYNAIQQYYNTYMPTQPRDVATPLQNWYSKKYGA